MGGYWRLLDLLADPEHPEHAETKECLGNDFHLERFDQERANERLRTIFARRS